MSSIREVGRVKITGLIRLTSGLHIGAGKDSVEIGGIDNPVIKHPFTGEPYIPGSSIKGKLRFLLEWAFGTVRDDGHAWGYDDKQDADPADPVLRIFGNALKGWKAGPTRLMVRDARLSDADRKRYAEAPEAFFEEKTEVLIDRISGKAHNNVGPRQTERVPDGVGFDLEMVFRLYDLGDGAERDIQCLDWLLLGLSLLKEDALGGSGSRGYGRIALENLQLHPPGGGHLILDNRFPGHRFRRDTPPGIIRAEEILGVPA